MRIRWNSIVACGVVGLLLAAAGCQSGDEADGTQASAAANDGNSGAGSTGTEGTGLGLAVVEALAKRWGGGATIRNRAGAGARAEVRLPAATLPTPDRQLDEALPGGG